MTDVESLGKSVQRILSASWNADVQVRHPQVLRDGKCFRFAIVPGHQQQASSVIVKKAVDDPNVPTDPDSDAGNPAQPLLEEWAGLQFLNEVLPDKSLVPRFHGGDREGCIIVMEDMGDGATLLDALHGNDPSHAERSLQAQARALAELHAGTLGKEARYWEIRDGLGPRDVPRDWKRYGIVLDAQGWGNLGNLRPDLLRGFDVLGQTVPAAFWDEYEALQAAIEGASPFRTYIQSDACPDNAFLANGRLRLMDFERGGYHHSLLDAAFSRLSMPCCYWANQIQQDVIASAEGAYRDRLGQAIPAAADDRLFGEGMTQACAYWIISNGIWLIDNGLAADFQWGSATWRQRVLLRLNQFAATTEEFNHLPAMGAAARETARRLGSGWTCDPVPYFVAFR